MTKPSHTRRRPSSIQSIESSRPRIKSTLHTLRHQRHPATRSSCRSPITKRRKSWGRCEVSEETSLTSQPTLPIATTIKVVIPGRAAVIHTPLRSQKNNPSPNQIFLTIAVFSSSLKPAPALHPVTFPHRWETRFKEEGKL